MKLKPLHNRLLIKEIKAPEKVGEFFIPQDPYKKDARCGIVEFGNKEVKKGSTVMFSRHGGYPVEIKEYKDYFIVNEHDVFCVMPKNYKYADFSEKAKWLDNFTDANQKDRISEQRVEHFADMIQAFRDGVLSREFVIINPDEIKKMLKSKTITQSEVDHAQFVWRDLHGWDKWYKGL